MSSIHELYGERMRIYMRPYKYSHSSKSGTIRKTSKFSRLFEFVELWPCVSKIGIQFEINGYITQRNAACYATD